VDVRHVDFKEPDFTVTPVHEGGRDRISQKMYTGDPYTHMQVKILKGPLKGMFAQVELSGLRNGSVVVHLRTLTIPFTHLATLPLKDVVDRQ
jgi:hypothetical protein